MNARTTLALPWLFLALIVGLMVWDQTRVRSGQADAGVTIDPVCGMEVRRATSYRLEGAGIGVYFCSTICRDEFAARPVVSAAVQPARDGHLMHGVPTWMFQFGIAVVLLLSFGLFEAIEWLRPQGAATVAASATEGPRVDLLRFPGLRRLLKWGPLTAVLRVGTALAFVGIIVVGLFGNQNPALNLAPLLTWTIWWAGLVFLILFAGKAWCTICPWDAIAGWLERLRFWGPRRDGLGLGLRWPRMGRNIWFAVGLFVALTWVELGMGITMIPRATAWVALGMLGLAIVSAFIFDRKSFCRYGCLVGRVSGLYALFSSLELRTADRNACAGCKTSDCYKGNEHGDGCPTFEFPRVMNLSTYCILCTECIKTCPQDNISLRVRPWGADLVQTRVKPRQDEAVLALVLLSMTGFHGLTMTPTWPRWISTVRASLECSEGAAFSVLMLAMLILPILLFRGLSTVAAWWAKPASGGRLFIEYAYAMLPIALFYHLAHNAEHFLMEGPKAIALASDPFGWGWNVFGTARWTVPPLITLEGLWWIQLIMILVGHIYSLWISAAITRRLVADRRAAFLTQLPMLFAMILFSISSLWLLKQPMEMRSSM